MIRHNFCHMFFIINAIFASLHLGVAYIYTDNDIEYEFIPPPFIVEVRTEWHMRCRIISSGKVNAIAIASALIPKWAYYSVDKHQKSFHAPSLAERASMSVDLNERRINVTVHNASCRDSGVYWCKPFVNNFISPIRPAYHVGIRATVVLDFQPLNMTVYRPGCVEPLTQKRCLDCNTNRSVHMREVGFPYDYKCSGPLPYLGMNTINFVWYKINMKGERTFLRGYPATIHYYPDDQNYELAVTSFTEFDRSNPKKYSWGERCSPQVPVMSTLHHSFTKADIGYTRIICEAKIKNDHYEKSITQSATLCVLDRQREPQTTKATTLEPTTTKLPIYNTTLEAIKTSSPSPHLAYVKATTPEPTSSKLPIYNTTLEAIKTSSPSPHLAYVKDKRSDLSFVSAENTTQKRNDTRSHPSFVSAENSTQKRNGIGISMVVITATLASYYMVIMGYTLHFIFSSFTSRLPWTICKEEWLDDCCFIRTGPSNTYSTSVCSGNRSDAILCQNNTLCKCSGVTSYDFDPSGCTPEIQTAAKNASYNAMLNLTRYCPNLQICTNRTKTPSGIYFYEEVLETTVDMNAIGSPLWDVTLCLLLAWIIVIVCNIGGVKTSGKIVYFTVTFPYVMILILLIRGSVLPGAGTGMAYYLVPDFTKLGSIKVWRAAAGQLFLSLGISFGVLINLGSFNTFQNNICNDAIIIACADLATSFFAGLMVFTYIGVLAQDIGVPIDKVAKTGYGLVFVIYPEALAMLPGKHFWSVVFFIMLFTLGVDTEFALVECVITSILDIRPQLRKYRTLLIVIFGCIGFLLGLPYTTPGGTMVLDLVDKFTCTNVLFFICVMELVTVAWIFGAEEFYANITYMIGREYPLMGYWKLSWKYLSPIAVSIIFLLSLVYHKRYEVASGVLAPGWAEAVGWLLFFSVIAPIPLCFGKRVYKADGSTWLEKVKHATAASQDWHTTERDRPQITEKLENDEIETSITPIDQTQISEQNTANSKIKKKKKRKHKNHLKASDLNVITEPSTPKSTET